MAEIALKLRENKQSLSASLDSLRELESLLGDIDNSRDYYTIGKLFILLRSKTKRQILWFTSRESTNIRSFEWLFPRSLLKEREILAAFSCDRNNNAFLDVFVVCGLSLCFIVCYTYHYYLLSVRVRCARQWLPMYVSDDNHNSKHHYTILTDSWKRTDNMIDPRSLCVDSYNSL